MATNNTLWIDGFNPSYESSPCNVGDVFFLIEHSNPVRRSESHSLDLRPPKTNQSFEYRVHGWCGSWNDNNTYGCGIVQVARVAKNGRIKVRLLTAAGNSKTDDFIVRKADDCSLIEKFLEDNGFSEEFSWK